MPLNQKGQFSDPILYLEDGDVTRDGRVVGDVVRGRPVMVMVFAEWCGHCKHTRPEYQKAADKMSNEVFWSVIHSDSDRPSVKKLMPLVDSVFEVKGYPTIFGITAQGRRVPYQGPRTEEAFLSFAQGLFHRA